MSDAGTQTKAYLLTEKNVQIPCMFNPAKLSIKVGNEWKGESMPKQSAPEMAFKGGKSGSMSLELFFDTTGTGAPVTSYTTKLLDLMKIDKTLDDYKADLDNGRPQYVQFCWGSMKTFPAVITDLTVSFLYFSSTGTPLRAKGELSLVQFKPSDVLPAQNPTSGTPKPHRVHRVQKGETLDRISARHYGDSTKWRLLAEANGITDPLALRPGAFLNIPKVEAD